MTTKKKVKTVKKSNPKIYWLQDNDGLSIYDYGNMTYDAAMKKAKEIVIDSYAHMSPCSITILKEVAEIKPKTTDVEIVVKEIK